MRSKYGWLGLTVILVVVGAVIFSQKNKEKMVGDEGEKKKLNNFQQFEWPNKMAKYITHMPVDLTQIQSISKYRSCSGHIRDGYNFWGELELDRSMKHYLLPVRQFQNTNDKVKIFAPFDGTVIRLDWEKDKGFYGRENAGNGIHLSTPVDPNIDMVIGHIYFVKDFKPGDKVKGGELLGYAATGCGTDPPGCDFDLDLSTLNGTSAYQGREVLGYMFDHMTEAVLAEFAKFGVTPENAKFTKEYRDAHLCGFEDKTSGKERNKEQISAENYVQLKH